MRLNQYVLLFSAVLVSAMLFSSVNVSAEEKTSSPFLSLDKTNLILPKPDLEKEKNIPIVVLDEKDHDESSDVISPDLLEKAKAVKKKNITELTDMSKFFLYNKNPFQTLTATVSDWVSGGRLAAMNILAEAMAKTAAPQFKSIYETGRNKLAATTFSWPNPGFEFTLCNGATLAYTYVNTSVVYICRRVIDQTQWQLNELAQIMIHEAAHTIGYANECDASVIEVSAMRYASVGLRFRNGYLEKCGIQ
jgi:hypothetical protein